MSELVWGLELEEHDIIKTLKSTENKSVITNSGLGNLKDSSLSFNGVTFVVVDGTDYHLRKMEHGIGMEDSRRNHIRQIQAALDYNEMQYYNPISKFAFGEVMKGYSMMEHAKPDPKFVNNERKFGELIANYYSPNKPNRRNTPKIGRNELCPCGSNKKHKKCCMT